MHEMIRRSIGVTATPDLTRHWCSIVVFAALLPNSSSSTIQNSQCGGAAAGLLCLKSSDGVCIIIKNITQNFSHQVFTKIWRWKKIKNQKKNVSHQVITKT